MNNPKLRPHVVGKDLMFDVRMWRRKENTIKRGIWIFTKKIANGRNTLHEQRNFADSSDCGVLGDGHKLYLRRNNILQHNNELVSRTFGDFDLVDRKSIRIDHKLCEDGYLHSFSPSQCTVSFPNLFIRPLIFSCGGIIDHKLRIALLDERRSGHESIKYPQIFIGQM